MSCITQLLKLKGEKEFLPGHEGYVIEGGGVYKNLEYLITFTDLGSRCGYVAIRKCDIAAIDDVNCHGGITFDSDNHHAKSLLSIACNDRWIGFDCAHWGDMRCYNTARKYFSHIPRLNYKINMLEKIHEEVHALEAQDPGFTHKNYDYVEKQCKAIIDQLVAKHE